VTSSSGKVPLRLAVATDASVTVDAVTQNTASGISYKVSIL
jgi:hypothetical protein